MFMIIIIFKEPYFPFQFPGQIIVLQVILFPFCDDSDRPSLDSFDNKVCHEYMKSLYRPDTPANHWLRNNRQSLIQQSWLMSQLARNNTTCLKNQIECYSNIICRIVLVSFQAMI